MRNAEYAYLFLVFSAFAVSLYFYDALPDKMATHWGSGGKVNGYSSKAEGAFVTPVALALVAALFYIIPRTTVKKEHFTDFAIFFEQFAVTFLFFMFTLHIFIIAWNLGYEGDIGLVIPLLLGPLFYSAGHLLTNLDPAWNKPQPQKWPHLLPETNKRVLATMGKVFRFAGVLIFLCIAIPGYSIDALIIFIVGLIIWIPIYIIMASRREKE